MALRLTRGHGRAYYSVCCGVALGCMQRGRNHNYGSARLDDLKPLRNHCTSCKTLLELQQVQTKAGASSNYQKAKVIAEVLLQRSDLLLESFFKHTHAGMPVCMHAFRHSWINACMHACMHGWMDGCMDGWMDGWMDGAMHGLMGGWTDVSVRSFLSVHAFAYIHVCMRAYIHKRVDRQSRISIYVYIYI